MKSLFERNGFELSEDDLEKFRTYLKELKRWNRVHNLTSVRGDKEIVIRHFVDSLLLTRCFERINLDWKGKSVADVGSGAGFPGVPLKIYLKDINLTLIESVAKKCSFLEYLKVKLNLDYRVICDRAEKVNERFYIVVSRALGEFEKIIKILEKLSDGYVFVMKGRELKKEWITDLGYEPCDVNSRDLGKMYILWKKVK